MEDKDCLVCEKTFLKKKYESKARFAKKKFCCPECSRAYMKENRIGWYGGRTNSEVEAAEASKR